MMRTRLTPGAVVAALLGMAVLLLTGCGASLGGSEARTISSDDEIKIGLVTPRSGVYKPIGEDIENGFKLYLDQHEHKFGDHKVNLVIADEGGSASTGIAAVERLVKQEQVLALSGIVSSAVMTGIEELIQSEEVPLVGSNASPPTVDDASYIWRTSFRGDDPPRAAAEYMAKNDIGPVYLMGADYEAGHDVLGAFKDEFEAAGGTIAGEVYTPFPATKNYQPFLADIKRSGAEAVFVFYAGSAAIDFVKQYNLFGLTQTLYGPGFLTGVGILPAQGTSAVGVTTVMNYSPDLNNAANQAFVAAYQEAYDELPTTFAVASYDAAHVLDVAVGKAGGDLSTNALNDALGNVGKIDSPRGEWHFSKERLPIQSWYLREVELKSGDPFINVVANLGVRGAD